MQIGNGPYGRGPADFLQTSPVMLPAAYQTPGYPVSAQLAQSRAQAALGTAQSLSAFYLSVIGVAPAPTGGAEQALYLQALVLQAGSPQARQMLSSGSMSSADMIKFLMENPDQLGGLQGQGMDLSLAASLSAAAPSSESSASAAESESDGDSDLKEFSQDETMAAPSMCAMGGVSSADKAKPEMQQNLKEVKAISAAVSEMMKGEDGADHWMSMVLMQLRGKEQIMRSCLRRGKGAADEAYKSQGIDPKDDSAVSAFVARIGKEVITLAINCGLDIEVSEKRAARLDNRSGGLEKGEKGGKSPVGGSSAADKDEPFEIRTQKTDKHVELGVDEVEANPAMAGAILEQLLGLLAQRQADAANFQPPQVYDLGETRQGSPLDQAFGGPQTRYGGQALGGQPNGYPAGGPAYPAPSLRPIAAPSAAPGRVAGLSSRAAVGSAGAGLGLRGLMATLGITGQKFSTKIRVYEPNARVVIDRPGQGGVKVNGSLKGKAISVRAPKMVARAADGTLHRISGVHRVGNSGSFMASVKGEATGAEAAKQLFTRGDGSISIPGTKAN